MKRPHARLVRTREGQTEIVIGFALKIFGGVIISLLSASVLGLLSLALSHYALREQIMVWIERHDREHDKMSVASAARDHAIERAADLIHDHETAPDLHRRRER